MIGIIILVIVTFILGVILGGIAIYFINKKHTDSLVDAYKMVIKISEQKYTLLEIMYKELVLRFNMLGNVINSIPTNMTYEHRIMTGVTNATDNSENSKILNINSILDKINKDGIDSLSDDEKNFLDNFSKDNE